MRRKVWRTVPWLGGVAVLVGLVLSGAGWLGSARGADISTGRCPGAGKPPPAAVSRAQSLQFELMKRASFNYFDGARVVRDLRRNRGLWCGVIMDRPDSLIQLREIGSDTWSVDTLYVLSSGRNDRKLHALAERWDADEVRWINSEEAGNLLGTIPSRFRILVVWWD